MFKEDDIIKQLFNLNYKKQQTINALQKDIKGSKYHIKYIRKDNKNYKSEIVKLNNIIANLEKTIVDIKFIFKKGIDDELFYEFLNERNIVIKSFLFNNKNKLTFK